MSEQPSHSIEPVIHGTSQALREALAEAHARAPGLAPVLILAEQGLEVPELAALIHAASGRAGPFVRLYAPELISHYDRVDILPTLRDVIARAHGGTLLIEEVYELPLYGQAIIEYLLNQQVRSPASANVRLLVSTSMDLAEQVAEGEFRSGLLQRLMFGSVALPPLCERGLDVGLLAERILREHPYLTSRTVTGLEPAAVATLIDHDWPDNLPELEAVIVRATLYASGERLDDVDIERAFAGIACAFSCLGPDTEGYVRSRPAVPGLDEPAEQGDASERESIPATSRRPIPAYAVADQNVIDRAFGPLSAVELSPEHIKAQLTMVVEHGFRRLLYRIDGDGPVNLEQARKELHLPKRHARRLLAVLVEDGMLAVSGVKGQETWSRPMEA